MNNERYEKGMETIGKMAGKEGIADLEGVRRAFPDFYKAIVEFGFGDIYSRPVLDLKQRELVTLSSLITQGAVGQLPFHVHAALNVGLTPGEIMEIVLHCALYAGFPKAVGALSVVMQVFAERKIEMES